MEFRVQDQAERSVIGIWIIIIISLIYFLIFSLSLS